MVPPKPPVDSQVRRRIPLALAALLLGLLLGIAIGVSVGQPSLVAAPARAVLAQAEALDRVALGMVHDPRDVADQIEKLRARAAEIRKLPPASTARNAYQQKLLADIAAAERVLRAQNAALEDSLWKAHEGAAAVREQLTRQVGASDGTAVIAYDQLRRFLKWTGPLVAVALLLAAFAATSPGIRAWISRATSFAFGPLTIAVSDVAKLKSDVRERFAEVDAAIAAAYEEQLARADMGKLFAILKEDIDERIRAVSGVDMRDVPHRATLFVPGFTDDELVQAAGYLGSPGKLARGQAAPPPDKRKVIGRRFSVRFGIIGRAWRLRMAQYNPKVSNDFQALVRFWGLTQLESFKLSKGDASLLAIVVTDGGVNDEPLGIVYYEATGLNRMFPRETVADLTADAGRPDGATKGDALAQQEITAALEGAKRLKEIREQLQSLRRLFDWNLRLKDPDQ